MTEEDVDGIVELYTDGACRGNPGPGGWAALLQFNGHEKVLAGFLPDTTNNRMEILAAIEGLKAIKRPSKIKIYTDSMYLKDGLNVWLPKWRANNWLKADRKPVKNIDLWQELDALCALHTIEWVWVRAHAGNVGNERVDTLARQQISLHSIAQTIQAQSSSAS